MWTAAIVVFTVPSISSLPGVYPTAAARQGRAALADNPAFVLLTGPGHGTDNYTFGAMVANEMLGFVALLMAFMSIFLVVRHTRAEEQYGRSELVRAAVVGRFAEPTASLVVVGGMNILIGVILAVSLPGLGMDLSVGGSVTFAVAAVSVGLVFAGVALFTAQVSEYARGATGMASAVLGAAYLVRGVGDMGNGALSWLSPFGWAQATQAYVDDRLWPALIGVAVAAGLCWAALAVSTRRDVGGGLVAPRRGAGDASPLLANPVVFALRMQRGALIGWAVGMAAFGALYGTLITEIEQFAADNQAIQDFIAASGGGGFLESFLAAIIVLLAVTTAGFAIQSSLRVRSEETAGRAEPVLATARSRSRWMGGYLTVSLLGSAAIAMAAGLGLATTAAVTSGDGALFGSISGAMLGYIPALWVVVGLAAALFGWVPRLTPLVWAVLAYAVTLAMLGGLLDFPEWTLRLSPFDHVPAMPVEGQAWGSTVALLAVAAVLVVAGVVGFRRRDIDMT